MKASELVTALNLMIAKHGDKPVLSAGEHNSGDPEEVKEIGIMEGQGDRFILSNYFVTREERIYP